jgi:threonyl-tRNA synthetase
VATVLAGAAAMDTPCLPTWLSPTQVRFVPLDADHVPYCDGLADELAAAGVRADVDDRPETVGDRIARAEADWVPYYAVVGDREVDGDPLPVTVRTGDTEVGTTLDELRRRVRDETEGYPRKRRYLPGRLDDHPGFGDR